MNRFSVRQLVTAGLLAALVVVGTMLIQVPTPTKGYIHIGDSMVYLCGILLGPVLGGLAAAIGSALADVMSGYGMYAPATFIIKGLDAMVVGYIYLALAGRNSTFLKNAGSFATAVLAGGIIMVSGYLLYETFLYGFAPALLNVALNVTQAVGGGIIAAPLLAALEKMGLRQSLS